MKTQNLSKVFVITLLTNLFFYCSDNSTIEPENSLPLCSITFPQSYSIYKLSENVEIKVEAEDSDGEIESVRFSIDGIQENVDYNPPYEYTWQTSGEGTGVHTINVVAVDNDEALSAVQTIGIVIGDSTNLPIEESHWDIAKPQNEGLDAFLINELHEKISSDYHWMRSFLIVRNGKLVFERYYGGARRNTLMKLYSSAKSFVGAYVGIALEKGYIENENVPLFDYFPEYAHFNTAGKEKITIEHLLKMASGLEWNELNISYLDPLNDLIKFYRSADPLEYFLSKPLSYEPGTKWYYSGAMAYVLGEIVRRATGMEVDQFTKEYLFRPLGIRNYVWVNRPDGHASGHGLELLSARDMAKFGQLYLQEGVWNGEQIISKDWVSRSTRYPIDTGDARWYGYQFWVSKRNNIYYALGLGGQYIYIVPEYDIVIVSTNNYLMEDASTHLNQVNIIPVLIQNYVLAAVNSNKK